MNPLYTSSKRYVHWGLCKTLSRVHFVLKVLRAGRRRVAKQPTLPEAESVRLW